MTWQENPEDFGEEIKPGTRFRFECHPELSCFGTCCATDVALTPYDIARMRRHMGIDTHEFLSFYCASRVDSRTGFPYVLLKRKENGLCVFSESHGCDIYESRPSCCRHYPLARVIEDEGQDSKRPTKYYLQRRAAHCKGMGRGPEWTIETHCEENGLGPYERANDLFLQVPFAFDTLPFGVRQDKEVQTMIYQAVFDFDRFFETYGRFGSFAPPEDDHEMIVLLTGITLNLIRRTAHLKLEE
jgi:Fe-S-cluster containining protein